MNDLSIDESMSEVFERLTVKSFDDRRRDLDGTVRPRGQSEGNGVKVVEDAEAYSQAGHVALAISALRDGLTTFGICRRFAPNSFRSFLTVETCPVRRSRNCYLQLDSAQKMTSRARSPCHRGAHVVSEQFASTRTSAPTEHRDE